MGTAAGEDTERTGQPYEADVGWILGGIAFFGLFLLLFVIAALVSNSL